MENKQKNTTYSASEQESIMNVLSGKAVVVRKHVSRNKNKFHDVKTHVRKVPNPLKDLEQFFK